MILNSNIPVYKSQYKENVHPQEKCSVQFSTKNTEKLLLAKVDESKKINIGFKSQHIFQLLKKNKSIDMNVLDLHKHTSVYDKKVKFQKLIYVS